MPGHGSRGMQVLFETTPDRARGRQVERRVTVLQTGVDGFAATHGMPGELDADLLKPSGAVRRQGVFFGGAETPGRSPA